MISAPSTAIVGAGIAGLTAARALADRGYAVTVFDKARGMGGRTSTRRTEQSGFDHGAQYFTVRHPAFARQVKIWEDAHVVAEWAPRQARLDHGRFQLAPWDHERYVGIPGMNAMTKALARGLMVQLSTCIAALERMPDGWQLIDQHGHRVGRFEHVILAIPAPQAMALLPESTGWHARLSTVQMAPCWTVMLTLDAQLPVRWDAGRPRDNPLAWVARNSAKPRRQGRESWVLQATPEWSAEHLDDDAIAVISALTTAFRNACGGLAAPPTMAMAHRWRYAMTTKPLGVDCLWSPDDGIGACGDWCRGRKIEDAWLSGQAMARALIPMAETA